VAYKHPLQSLDTIVKAYQQLAQSMAASGNGPFKSYRCHPDISGEVHRLVHLQQHFRITTAAARTLPPALSSSGQRHVVEVFTPPAPVPAAPVPFPAAPAPAPAAQPASSAPANALVSTRRVTKSKKKLTPEAVLWLWNKRNEMYKAFNFTWDNLSAAYEQERKENHAPPLDEKYHWPTITEMAEFHNKVSYAFKNEERAREAQSLLRPR